MSSALSGTAALALLTLGGLLICLECNRPGRVLPGALGLLLLLLGGRAMVNLAAPPRALLAAGTGVLLLLLLWWRPLAGLPGLAGTTLLALSFTWWAGAARTVSPMLAAGCGALLGTVISLLLLLAGRARRAKYAPTRRQPPGLLPPVLEHWGVD